MRLLVGYLDPLLTLVVSRPCTDDRITLPHLTICTTHKRSSVEKRIEGTKNKLEDLPLIFSILDLLFLHGSHFAVSFKVIFWRNGKKDSKDACKI
jgi:hypothetical protein